MCLLSYCPIQSQTSGLPPRSLCQIPASLSLSHTEMIALLSVLNSDCKPPILFSPLLICPALHLPALSCSFSPLLSLLQEYKHPLPWCLTVTLKLQNLAVLILLVLTVFFAYYFVMCFFFFSLYFFLPFSVNIPFIMFPRKWFFSSFHAFYILAVILNNFYYSIFYR